MATLPAGIASTPGSNRFSRITKASAAVRLILVRSRRSDGRREEWSGLSESNRHLNLGKVPYYHYTKAATLPSFYSMPATQPQAYLTPGRAYSHRIPLAELKCVSPKRRLEMAARLGGEAGGQRRGESPSHAYFRPLFRSGA